MSMLHRPLMAGFFALLALFQALLALGLGLAVVEMMVATERFEHAEESVGVALAGAFAFTVTTIFSVRAAFAMWTKWKTGRREGGPSHPAPEINQTE